MYIWDIVQRHRDDRYSNYDKCWTSGRTTGADTSSCCSKDCCKLIHLLTAMCTYEILDFSQNRGFYWFFCNFLLQQSELRWNGWTQTKTTCKQISCSCYLYLFQIFFDLRLLCLQQLISFLIFYIPVFFCLLLFAILFKRVWVFCLDARFNYRSKLAAYLPFFQLKSFIGFGPPFRCHHSWSLHGIVLALILTLILIVRMAAFQNGGPTATYHVRYRVFQKNGTKVRAL